MTAPDPFSVALGGMTVKRVLRYDPGFRCLRLFRIMWRRRAGSSGFSRRLSVALRPMLLHFKMDVNAPEHGFRAWRCTILGIRLHYERDDRGVLV